MLVAAVVLKKAEVQLSSRFDVMSPYKTTNPAPIPMRLNST
jgi:hypothetical protein